MGLPEANSRVVALVVLQILAVWSYDLHIRVEEGYDVAIWECTTNVPIQRCQINWIDYTRGRDGLVLDVEEGLEVYLNDETTGVVSLEYSGRSFADGDCGVRVKISVVGAVRWMVGCRVHAVHGWKYAWSDFMGTELPRISGGLTAEPREVVVLPGQDAIAVCKAPESLHTCFFGPPEMTSAYIAIEGDDFTEGSRHFYHGNGTNEGDCGIRISEVDERDNGLVNCEVKTYLTGSFGWRLVPIVVALRPVSVTLQTVYSSGTLFATCTVDISRPVASIRWLLDDKLMRHDDFLDGRPTLSPPWSWPWDANSISQKIQWELRPEDDGKTLTCEVSHPALDHPVPVSDTLVYSDDPDVRTNIHQVIIDEIFSKTTIEPSTSMTTEPSTSTTTEPSTSTTTEPSTSTTTEPSTSTTEGPHTECCCYVRRCHSLFRNNRTHKACIKTFTCLKVKLCCPQL